MTTKTKIVLDADVIIHFVKAGQFSLLLDIFPEYQYLILDVVYDEVTVNRLTKTQIGNTLQFFASRIENVKRMSSLTRKENLGMSMRGYVTHYSWAKGKVPAWCIAATIRMFSAVAISKI